MDDSNTSPSPVQPPTSEAANAARQQNIENHNMRLTALLHSPLPSEYPASFKTPNRVTQQAIHNHLVEIGDLFRSQTNKEGDTVLAIVKFPPDMGPNRACSGNKWQDLNLLMNYDKLMSLRSSKIEAMFKDKAQARIRRTHGLNTLPPGVKYVLDFTPPSEGFELADLTAALWLPRTVKLWFLVGHFIPDAILAEGPNICSAPGRALADKAVGACLVLGHDDLCRYGCCVLGEEEWEVKNDTPGIFQSRDELGDSHIPEFRKVDDYCPIRHRASIIRVLRAINGNDLLLNSATRMWSVAQTAIHLEVPQVVVDPVTQWLIAPPNTKFIEICPERAFQLAYALKIPSVLITAFEILVSELAVDLTAPVLSPVRPARTWVGRHRDDYGDFPSDPVDYAARAFVDRISGYANMLLSDTIFDSLPFMIPEWRKLRELGEHIRSSDDADLLKASYNLLVEALPVVVHRKVRHAIEDDLPIHRRYVPLIEAQRAHYLPPADRKPIQFLYRDLSPAQRVLTPFFWRGLAAQTDYDTCQHAFHNGRSIHSINQEFRNLLAAEVLSGRLTIPGFDHEEHARSRDGQAQESQNGSLRGLNIEFNVNLFFAQVADAVSNFCDSVVNPTREAGIPLLLSDHLLLNLAEKELDFLPIWAGGLDDGTGGVFQELVPEAEMGPSEPGPGYHTGFTIATDTSTLGGPSTIAPSDLGLENLDIESVTNAQSVVAEQSVTTGPGPGRNVVVAMGSSMQDSDSFSAANDLDYAEAMFAQPASHQAHGRALADYVEDDGESTVSSFTVGDDTISKTETGQRRSTDTGSNSANNDDFDIMDMEHQRELDFSDDSDSTLGSSDYDMI